MVACYHAVKEPDELFKGKDIWIICHPDRTDIEVYRVCVLVAFLDKYYVSVGSFHLLVCKINHLLCFSAASWACN